MEYYFIKYTYYQYNSGAADNGTYVKKLEFTNRDDAFTVYDKFQKYLNDELDDNQKRNLEDKYIPYAGFFKEANIFHSVATEVTL